MSKQEGKKAAAPKNSKALILATAMDDEKSFLAVLEQDTKGEATSEEIREQMGNVEPRLERIEVKHSGSNMFVFPGGEPVKGEDGFLCVIIASNFHNAKYRHAYDDPKREADERPECKSSDGVTIDPDSESPKAANCSVCPLNCQATSQQAKDLAFSKERTDRCQNRLSLVVMLPGHALPYILQLSPRSFKHFASYAQRVGSQSRFLLHEVATQITLKKVGQHAHSEAQFSKKGAIAKELRAAYKEAHENALAYLRRTATTDRIDDAEERAKADAETEANTGGNATEAPL